MSAIASKMDGKIAHLSFRRLQFRNQVSLIEINLGTGRHHQIRLQLSNLGFPILGDFAYGSKTPFPQKSIALHAYAITIHHPVKNHEITFTAQPNKYWPLPL
jgi:23S rRNA pseudouridine1911/1915/1917 synthase